MFLPRNVLLDIGKLREAIFVRNQKNGLNSVILPVTADYCAKFQAFCGKLCYGCTNAGRQTTVLLCSRANNFILINISFGRIQHKEDTLQGNVLLGNALP